MPSINVRQLVSNDIDYPDSKKYAAILGSSVSNGARSPRLWNAAFNALDLDIQMLPLDVSSQNITSLYKALELDENFIGGAVAVPYKEKIYTLVSNSEEDEIAGIGAVNNLIRGEKRQLLGKNTDGQAAIASYEKVYGSIDGKSILILGMGGVGKAVSVFFGLESIDRLVIATRKPIDLGSTNTGKNVENILWSELRSILPSIEVVVNCTTLGSVILPDQSPIEMGDLKLLPNNAIVFDVNYNPKKTKLLVESEAIGLRVLNGESMNQEQAVFGFMNAASSLGLVKFNNKNIISKAMGGMAN